MSGGHVDVLAARLAEEGVAHAFGVVGGGASIRLAAALEERGVAYHPVAHEAAAAMAAGACCRDGATRAVALTIKGPGFANLLPGIASNAYENRPALTVSEAYGPTSPPEAMHKRLDHARLAAPLVKAYGVADAAAAVLSGLLAAARAEAPGPAHLDLPAEPGPAPMPSERAPERPTDSRALSGLLEAVRRARRPALALGSAAWRLAPAVDWALAGVPVVTTAAAKGALDERSPLAAGVVTGEVAALSPETRVLAEADLVVGVGLRNTEVVRARPLGAESWLLDVVGGGLHEGFGAHSALVADLSGAAALVVEACAERSWGAEAVAWRRRDVASALAGEWTVAGALETLQTSLPAETVLVPDTGLHCVVAETVWLAASPRAFCGSSNGRFMGTGLPTALGVAVSTPGAPVVCLAGDGGVRPYLPELALAVAERLPLLVVLVADGGYGTVAAGSPDLAASRAVRADVASWYRAVDAMGCPARLVRSYDALAEAASEWRAEGGPLFLELPFDPGPYGRMTAELR